MSERHKLFQITEKEILRYSDKSSFSKGVDYFDNGMIYDAYLIGNILKAKCKGSMQVDYALEVKFSKNGIEDFNCSCPRGDFCKHIVALLLTYIRDFDSIRIINVDKQKEILGKKSKKELIGFIMGLVEQNPALINLMESEITDGSIKNENKDLKLIISQHRKLADGCFKGLHYESPYYASFGVAERLRQLFKKAQNLKERDKISSVAMFTAIFESIDKNLEIVDDSNGEVSGIAGECVEELQDILSQFTLETQMRHEWQEIMLNHFVVDDYGIGDEVDTLLLETCKEEDIDILQNLARKELNKLPRKDDFHTDFMRKHLSNFIAELYKIEGKGEMALQLYKEQELHFEYVMELVDCNRLEEAIEYAKQCLKKGYEAFHFAQTLLEKDLEKAMDFILCARKNLYEKEPYYWNLLEMLASIYVKKREWRLACDLYMEVFKREPSVENLKKLEKVAKHLDEWESVKKNSIEYLITKKMYEALVRIYLYLGEVSLAINNLNQLKKEYPFFFGYESLALGVAKAAESSSPEESIRIYKGIIEKRITAMGRDNYREAVQYLTTLKRLSNIAEFENYLKELKQKYIKRRAFLEELGKLD